MVVALRGVAKHAGQRISPVALLRASSVLKGLLGEESESIRMSSGRALGIISEAGGACCHCTLSSHQQGSF